MYKKILLFCVLLSITSCQKDNPVAPTNGGSTQTTGNMWKARTGMPTARGYICCAEVDGKIYLIGGIIDLTPKISDDVEMYDPETDKWTIKNHMPEKILGMAAASVDGKIYTFGGRTGALYSGTTLNYTYLYDPAADTWTRKNDMLIPRAFISTSVVDGKIYTIGGCSEGYEGSSKVEVYDPVTDTWTPKASLAIGRGLCSATVFNGKIYVVGGGTSHDASSGTSYPYFDIFDPASNTWDSRADLETSRFGHGAGLINNKLYICGGISSKIEGGVASPTLLSDLKEYDFNSDTWIARVSMSTNRRSFASCVYNNKLFVFGGVIDVQATNSVLEYIPPDGSD